MIKQYFKKVLWAVAFGVMFVVCFFLDFIVLYTIKNLFISVMALWYVILFGILLVEGVLFGYLIRVDNKEKYKQYIQNKTVNGFSFIRDIRYILKSKDYVLEVLVWVTLAFPLLITIGVLNKTPILPLIIGSMILTLIAIFIFSVVDIFIWLLVHRNWAKR